MAAEKKRFTDKQQAFIYEYLKDFNAAAAARRAGYSENSCNEIGAQNLAKLNIQTAIQAAIAEKAMSADEVLLRLAEQARGAQSDYFKNKDGTKVYLDLEAMRADGRMHLVKELEADGATGHITKVKFYDAQAALVQLGRHHKLFTDKTEHSGTLNVRDVSELTDDELLRIAQQPNGD